jgi:membrane protein implicated in regulation of membrane protease activity
MLVPGLILFLVGLFLWWLTPVPLAWAGAVCAIIGAVLLIIAVVELASARTGRRY